MVVSDAYEGEIILINLNHPKVGHYNLLTITNQDLSIGKIERINFRILHRR